MFIYMHGIIMVRTNIYTIVIDVICPVCWFTLTNKSTPVGRCNLYASNRYRARHHI